LNASSNVKQLDRIGARLISVVRSNWIDFILAT
jgi:hypothetical protein